MVFAPGGTQPDSMNYVSPDDQDTDGSSPQLATRQFEGGAHPTEILITSPFESGLESLEASWSVASGVIRQYQTHRSEDEQLILRVGGHADAY